MAQNQTIVAALSADPIPPERECLKNASDVAAIVEDFIKVTGLASASPGSPFPTSNNISQQALETANSALALAQTVQGQIRQRRTSGTTVSLPAGDSVQVLTWTPSMPSTNYEIQITIFGSNAALAAAFSWHGIDGSRLITGCQVRFDNVPAGYSYTWSVEEL